MIEVVVLAIAALIVPNLLKSMSLSYFVNMIVVMSLLVFLATLL